METLLTKITPRLIREMDKIIREGWFANRSELIRAAIREKIRKMKSEHTETALREDVEWGLH